MSSGKAELYKADISVTHVDPYVLDELSTLIHNTDQSNVAQAPQWLSVIQNAYGHTPLYLKAEDAKGEIAILPAFLLRSRLFGTVVCSMPFLDAGGPYGASASLAHTLVDTLVKEAGRLKADLVELRCTAEMPLSVPARQDKVNLFLPLSGDPDCLWQQLNAKVRNQVRKAGHSGLSVEFGGVEKLDDFYEVFAINMRDLGSPVHSRNFFGSIFDAFGCDARVAIVRKGAEPIGGLVAIAFKNTLVVPWASSLRQYFPLCSNMLLYWETIRDACLQGFQRFDFGRSSRGSGTYKFKRQWGALEEPLYWYTIPLNFYRNKRFSSNDARGEFLVNLWKHLPLGMARWLGPHIRKNLTQ